MRFLLTIEWDTKAGNELTASGKLGDVVGSILEDLKPEAAYFSAINGNRGVYLIVHMDDMSELPAIAEPWYHAVKAKIDIVPVMTPEDLEKAGPSIGAAIEKYGS